MDRKIIPCELGPLDGEDRPHDPSGWLVHVTSFGVHRYLLRQTAEGWMYWAHYEVVPLSAASRA